MSARCPVELCTDMTILFQGDSITDAWRRMVLPDGTAPFPLGVGYAYMVAARLLAAYPHLNLNIVNRGVGGDRVREMRSRWKPDCLDVKPDLLSLHLGINDTWRTFDSNDPTSLESFLTGYRTLLRQVKDTCDPILVLCEPFVLPYPDDRRAWRVDLDPRIHAVRDLAREFNAILVPFDGIFAAASTRAHPRYWTEDGVHPTPAGYALMAQAWITHVLGPDARI